MPLMPGPHQEATSFRTHVRWQGLQHVLSHHTLDGNVVEDVEEANMDELLASYAHYDPRVQKIITLIPQSNGGH